MMDRLTELHRRALDQRLLWAEAGVRGAERRLRWRQSQAAAPGYEWLKDQLIREARAELSETIARRDRLRDEVSRDG